MAPIPDGKKPHDGADGSERSGWRRRDVLWLVLATYRASLPYFLVFLLGMALATWIVTEVLF